MERDLGVLLDAFGSMLSLEVIADAYCKAKRNVDKAGEILSEMQRSKSDSHWASEAQWDCSSASSSETAVNSFIQNTNKFERIGASKAKKCSASMGTVSCVIGKDYVTAKPSINEHFKATKPLKIDSKDLRSSESALGIRAENGIMQEDVERFLFAMLGDGFQLDKNVVHEVLGSCGYDVNEGMEKLLDLSASTLEKSDDIVRPTDERECLISHSNQEKMQRVDSCDIAGRREIESSKRNRDRDNLQREVLASLFNAPERSDVIRKPRMLRKVRSQAFGKVVVEPERDDETTEHVNVTRARERLAENESDDDNDGFRVLRQAVREHWLTMREYYEAAVDAFKKGDNSRADKLLEQGHFFSKKAREADEKSAQKLMQSNERKSEVVSLSILNQEPREARRLLRFHLTSISGIPSIEYMKVIVGRDDENGKKTSQKRVVTKVLERESIKWAEDENGEAVLIRVDEIDPNKLSFAQRPD